jgi:acyl carrier protein
MSASAFIALEAFPLSPNGKVDRRALSALAATDRLESAEPFVPARTPLEEVLCGIWADVLGREQLGVHENFFHLGGHSLLAMRIITQISELLLMDVPLRTFFAAPTIAALADYLETTAQQEQRDVQKIAQVVLRMNQLSDEQVQTLLKHYEQEEEQA